MPASEPLPSTLLRPDGSAIAYYRSRGVSPGVVFLGGFMSDMTGIKATTLEAWCQSQGRAFVRFDYYGHGASDGCFAEGTIGRWADDAIAVLDQLTQGPQILVGSSMGGWMMLLATRARPERVLGLLGIAAAPDLTEDLLWQRLDSAARQQLQDSGVLFQPSAYSETPYAITLRLIEEGRRHLLLRDTLGLSCPVRLLHGLKDPDVPWQTSVRLAERLDSADVRVILIKDGDHRLSRDSDLNLLTATLAELIALGQGCEG